MTRKIALSLALFASLGTTACTVDAPTRENFDYSFIEEMPEDIPAEFGFAIAYDGDFTLEFREGLEGTKFVEEKAVEVHVVIERVMVASIAEDGSRSWLSLRSSPADLDLMRLANGRAASLADGPIPPGVYGPLVFNITRAWVVDLDGNSRDLEMPGSVLRIDTEFKLFDDEPAILNLDFGALRTLEFDGDTWYCEPNVTFDIEYR